MPNNGKSWPGSGAIASRSGGEVIICRTSLKLHRLHKVAWAQRLQAESRVLHWRMLLRLRKAWYRPPQVSQKLHAIQLQLSEHTRHDFQGAPHDAQTGPCQIMVDISSSIKA